MVASVRRKELPPRLRQGCLRIGCWQAERNREPTAEVTNRGRRGTKKKWVTVDATAARLDRLGVTVSILRYENRTHSRKIAAHGAIITGDTPVFLEEVAIRRSLNELQEWVETLSAAGPGEILRVIRERR